MKNVKFDSLTLFKNEEIQKAMLTALKNGLRVFKSYFDETSKLTYFSYSDGKRIGYAQADYWGVNISSIHKPCREVGTGYRMTDEACTGITIEDLNRGFAFAPGWAKQSDFKHIRKYCSVDEWLNSRKHGDKMVEITL